jgi:hypothetical protein
MKQIHGMTDFQNDKHLERILHLIDRDSAIDARSEMLKYMLPVEYIQDLGRFLGGRLEFRLVFEFDKNGEHK